MINPYNQHAKTNEKWNTVRSLLRLSLLLLSWIVFSIQLILAFSFVVMLVNHSTMFSRIQPKVLNSLKHLLIFIFVLCIFCLRLFCMFLYPFQRTIERILILFNLFLLLKVIEIMDSCCWRLGLWFQSLD